MSREDSWLQRWYRRGLRPIRVCDYVYENPRGISVVRKTRFALMRLSDGKATGEKTFTVQHRSIERVMLNADAWDVGVGEWGDGLLFNRVSLDKAMLRGEDIFLVEGEKDAKSITSADWGVSTTWYQGGAGMRADQAKVLSSANGFVLICMDWDVTGIQLAWHNARMLVAAGVGQGQIQFLAPAKMGWGALNDVSDHIAAGLGVENLRSISALQLKRLVERYGELPRGTAARGRWDYETRMLSVGIAAGWKVIKDGSSST